MECRRNVDVKKGVGVHVGVLGDEGTSCDMMIVMRSCTEACINGWIFKTLCSEWVYGIVYIWSFSFS